MNNLLFNEKPCEILKVLRRNMMREDFSKNDLKKRSDTTYSHTVKICDKLEDLGLVSIEKKGRRALVSLTNDGAKVSEKLIEIEDVFEGGMDE